MRGKKAKAIRRKVYGKHEDYRARTYEETRTKIQQTLNKTGTFKTIGLRRAYQIIKRGGVELSEITNIKDQNSPMVT